MNTKPTQLVHVGVVPIPGGGNAIIGMRHQKDYRGEIVGYEILSAASGAGCDICGELIRDCVEKSDA